jgi:predicted amidohydrolase
LTAVDVVGQNQSGEARITDQLDLVIRKARIVDPARNIDAVLDIGFAAGKVACVGEMITTDAKQVCPAHSALLSPVS